MALPVRLRAEKAIESNRGTHGAHPLVLGASISLRCLGSTDVKRLMLFAGADHETDFILQNPKRFSAFELFAWMPV